MNKFKKENYKIILDWAFKKTANSIVRFMFLWIATNQWYKTRYEKEEFNLTDRDCIEKIKSDYLIYHQLLNNQNLDRTLEDSLIRSKKIAEKLNFINIPQVLLDPQKFPDGANCIKQDEGNYKTIIDLIYELRTKVFHGDISVRSRNILDLAKNLNEFLGYFLRSVILNPQITK